MDFFGVALITLSAIFIIVQLVILIAAGLLAVIVIRLTQKNFNFTFFAGTVLTIHIVINLLIQIPGVVEKYRKSTFIVPKSNRHFKIDSVLKSLNSTQADIEFNLAAVQSGTYQIMPGLTPCYKFISFNDQKVASTLPTINLAAYTPVKISMVFQRKCPQEPYLFEVGISPKSSNINLDGYYGIMFTNSYKELKEAAWQGYKGKSFLYIYLSDFDFNNQTQK